MRSLLVGWADGVGSRWLRLMSFQGAVRSLLVGWAVLVAGWLGLMSFQAAMGSLQADGFSHMWPPRLREGRCCNNASPTGAILGGTGDGGSGVEGIGCLG